MLNADAYRVTNGTFFLYVILLSISYIICAFMWGSEAISNRPISFLRLNQPNSHHPKGISIQCAIFPKFTKRLTDEQTHRTTIELNQ